MPVFRFTLILDQEELSDTDVDALFESGCDDSTPASRCGRAFVHFDRESESLLGSIRSAIRDVETAGLTVTRVEIDPSELSEDLS